jgi:hypothetical protein
MIGKVEVESGLRTLIAESELDAVTQVTDIFLGEVDRGGVEVKAERGPAPCCGIPVHCR